VVTRNGSSDTTMSSDLGSSDIWAFGYAGHGSLSALNPSNSAGSAGLIAGKYTNYDIRFMLLLGCETLKQDPLSWRKFQGTSYNDWETNVSKDCVVIGFVASPTYISPGPITITPGLR